MIRLLATCLTSWAVAAPATADEMVSFSLGGDSYLAGDRVRTEAPIEGDLFMAGQRLDLRDAVAGNAHLAGRRVHVDAPVEGALYAVGYSVTLAAPVGRASLAAAEVHVDAPVSGNLRISAAEVELRADVVGSVLVGAGDMVLAGAVAGDALLAVDDIRFDPGAKVGGMLTIVTDNPEEGAVPDSVAPPDRVVITRPEEAPDLPAEMQNIAQRGLAASIFGFFIGVAAVAALAALTVAVAPEAVQRARERTLAHPLRSIGLGFVVLSALTGSGFVLAMTVVGLLLLPAAILFAGLGFVAGYVMGSYILGVGLWRAIGKPLPDTWQRKAGLAVLGAGVAGLIVLIPLAGWLIWLLLVFAGLGGIAGATFGAKPQVA